MLTLPAEVTTEKNKIAYKPVLLVDFIDVPYHIGSQAYEARTASASDGAVSSAVFTSASATFETDGYAASDKIAIAGDDHYTILSVDSETQVTFTAVAVDDSGLTWYGIFVYNDNIQKSGNFTLTSNLAYGLNDIASAGQVTLKLVEFRGRIRSALLAAGADLTGSAVNLYLKFDTSTTLKSNAIKFMTGYVAKYTEKNDVMTLYIKSEVIETTNVPLTLLQDVYTNVEHEADWAKPLQYGDFSWTENPLFINDTENVYAFCPFAEETDTVSSTGTDSIHYSFFVADHEMNEIKSTSTDYEDFTDPYAFIRRGNVWCVIEGHDNNTIVESTSTDCMIHINKSQHSIHAIIQPTEVHAGATPATSAPNPENTYDGKEATYSQMDGTALENDIAVHLFDVGAIKDWAGKGSTYAYFKTTDGTYDTNDQSYIGWRKKSDDSTIGVDTVIAADGWHNVELIFGGADDIEQMNNYYIYIKCDSTDPKDDFRVAEIIVRVTVNDYDPEEDERGIYLRCIGREYDGTWGGRKVDGNPISNPVDMIESILRDELSITSLDTDAFDDINGSFSGIDVNATIYEQRTSLEYFKDMCRAFNVALIRDVLGTWTITQNTRADRVFNNSGTSTAGLEDIYNGTDTLSGTSFTSQPILRRSLQLKRTASNDVYDIVTLKYNKVFDSYLANVTNGSGDTNKTIFNPYIRRSSEASALILLFNGFWQGQKMVCTFTSFYNALAVQLGDIINIRHGDIRDEQVADTLITQKWVAIALQYQWRKNTIKITALELID